MVPVPGPESLPKQVVLWLPSFRSSILERADISAMKLSVSRQCTLGYKLYFARYSTVYFVYREELEGLRYVQGGIDLEKTNFSGRPLFDLETCIAGMRIFSSTGSADISTTRSNLPSSLPSLPETCLLPLVGGCGITRAMLLRHGEPWLL